MTKILLIIWSVLSLNIALASTVAIIDSGVDMKHVDIASNAWINVLELNGRSNRDEDRNGYQDDIYGWNFAENNNQVIDYSFLGTFSNDVYTFFDYQQRYLLGAATEEEIQWMRDKVSDQDFIKEISVFGNFIHGTHVAGIALEDSEGTKILAVKLIPTKVGLSLLPGQIKGGMDLVKGALDALARTQMGTMAEISIYISNHGASVANGSFGTGYAQAKMIAAVVFKVIRWRDAKPSELEEVSIYFLNALIQHGQIMAEEAPDTLFVFAAGNDGTDNDVLPTSPANLNAENTMSVAATFKRDSLAPFSNYGKKLVDVAAPGVAIKSSIPGDEWMRFSGTSQAAPYVTKIAGQIETINPGLKPFEVKRILMETVDKKDFLKDKVKTSGIVNFDRAVTAAKLALTLPLDQAISDAISRVSDVVSTGVKNRVINNYLNFVLPLPSGFAL